MVKLNKTEDQYQQSTATTGSTTIIKTEEQSTISPKIHWIIACSFLLLATIFGYRRLLISCLLLPIYSIGLIILLVGFNLGLSYWIHSQDLLQHSLPRETVDRKKRTLYDRLNFSTPAAYSAALTKKSWETHTEWRHEPLHPSLQPKTSAVLDRLIAKIMRDFVWKASRSLSMIPTWYDELCPPSNADSGPSPNHQHEKLESSTPIDTFSSPAFPLAVEKTIRRSLRTLLDRFGKIDLTNLIIHKILPILTTHVEAFRQAEYDLRGGGLGRLYRAFYSSGNDEIDLLLSRLHADRFKPSSRLHPAVDVPTPNSQSSEQAHLRKLLDLLLPLILPPTESKSLGVKTLVIELLTCSVITPVIEMLSDSDFWNNLIEERAGNVIREQRMVEQLRQVLDRQLSFVTTSSCKMETDYEFNTSTESISIRSTAKEFERFSRSIQRCNTLFDVRRLKNDVETQIRKAEAELQNYLESNLPSSNSQGELTKFLERLSAARDILDHRLAELGGLSGPALHKLQPSRSSSQILQEILRDRESPALSYFTEFMDRRQRVKLIQFWLAVEGLKNPLEEDLVFNADSKSVRLPGRSVPAKSYASSTHEVPVGTCHLPERDLDAMRADIQAIAEINFSTVEATDLLGLEQTEARAALFSMQRKVFDLMLVEDFPAFAAAGDLYLRATASLCQAFDERLPGERLTGPGTNTQYDQHILSLSNYTFPVHLPSPSSSTSEQYQSSIKFQSIHPISSTKYQMISPSLDFLISPPPAIKDDNRAPLFGDDINFAIRNVDPSNRPTTNQAEKYRKREPKMTADANLALQEALSSIISTSDQSPSIGGSRELPIHHQNKQHSSNGHQVLKHRSSCSSLLGDESGSTLDWPLDTRQNRSQKLPGGLDHHKAISRSTPSSPVSKPSQRKGLFDDDDEDEEENEEENDLLLIKSNKQSVSPAKNKLRKQADLPHEIRPVQSGLSSSTTTRTMTATTVVTNVAEADERIMKLENELILLSSLMRRAELTGNKLEIRLVKKSIESVGKEISENFYRKSRLIQLKEIASGGFRAKLVPGRVKLSITGMSRAGGTAPTPSSSSSSYFFFKDDLNIPSTSQQSEKEKKTRKNHSVSGSNTVQQQQPQEYVLYKIEVHKLTEDGSFGSGWIVQRRYNEFNSLNQSLKTQYPISRQLDFPSKLFGLTSLPVAATNAGLGFVVNVNVRPNLLGNNNNNNSTNVTNNSISMTHGKNLTLIEQRRLGLERYLKALIQIPVLCESPELAKFLSRSPSSSTSSSKNNEQDRPGEFFANTTNFVRSIYKSIVTGGGGTSSTSTSAIGIDDHQFMLPLSNSSSPSLSTHPLPPSPLSPSFSFSSQFLFDCFLKGFNKNSLYSINLHNHPSSSSSSIDHQNYRHDLSKNNRESIEINDLGKTKKKKKNRPINDHEEEEEEEEGYRSVDDDRLIDLTHNFKPIEGELLTPFTQPISNLLIEIFELNDHHQWLRKQGIVIILQQILGGTIERKFRELISDFLDDEHLSQLVGSIESALWFPDEEEDSSRVGKDKQKETAIDNKEVNQAGQLRPKPKPRSIEERLMTCDGAYRKLSAIIPDYAASILGRSNARLATRRSFSMFQNRRLNKHLIYTILDEIIKTLFPELIGSL
ncbi:hypothetical protein PSTG_12947 [Puccinia striiformis f. sp. tritici PST-78]|uniref:PX domain-containing protein n=1 Tax=Puccinia striiformis f. sp. tritici PST-78 TaxID=1165861 RepID=A0A0L0V3V0_9BASI|nr:hypothetical protein PSTG_12947 [Puccinia striiformis f. sp. tritici PST-78]